MNWKTATLTTAELVAGLLTKVILGFVYGYIYLHYYNGDDTWRFHNNSIAETTLLLSDPVAFFTNDITPAHALSEGKNWLHIIHLYLVDLQYAILVKPLAILNLVTRGNYYMNSFLFNCVIFYGHYLLFIVLNSLFPAQRKLFYVAVFLFVPAVFWLSGLRIDGLLFLFITIFIYNVFIAKHKSRALMICVSFIGIVICRPETALLIVPATIAYFVSRRFSPLKSFSLVYGICVFLFFASGVVGADGGLPGAVAAKQQAFLELQGTRFNLDPLGSDLHNYITVLPQALMNTYIRPFVWEAKGALQILAALEVVMFWSIVVAAYVYRRPDWRKILSSPPMLFLLFFSVSVYLSIGYVVPFPGAIIRYKAIALLLQVVVLCSIAAPESKHKFI